MTLGAEAYCPLCKDKTLHRHMHDTSNGIKETHIIGTERYVCIRCNHSIYRLEGMSLGLPFIYDKPAVRLPREG